MKTMNLPQSKPGLKVRTDVKAGGRTINHNQTLVRAVVQHRALKVKTHVKAGGRILNHNETFISGRAN